MPPKARNPKIEGHAAQMEDFSPAGQRVAKELVGETGNAHERMATRIARGAPAPGGSEGHAQKSEVKLSTLKIVAPMLKDAKVTLQTAANRRVQHFDNAVINEHGDPEGSGWYFQHHGDIASSAGRHGYDTKTAITASAVMSPNNSPDNEKAAVGALMDAHANHSVRVTKSLADAINARTGKTGAKFTRAHHGKDIAFSDLHPTQIAALSSGDFRDPKKAASRIKISTSAGEGTNEMLTNISRGGTKTNIRKAIGVLRGTTDRENAIDPHSSPKVWSYHHDIQNAVPNSAEHIEYMSRVGEAAGHGQTALDYGLRHSTKGILDPQGHTAEDTWQNAMTSGQDMTGRPSGRSGRSSLVSPGKVYGSEAGLGATGKKKNDEGVSVDPDSRVGLAAVQHAFNNKATRVAAEKVTKRSGLSGAGLPAVAVQEVGWTQARRVAGGDKEFNARQRDAAAPSSAMGGEQFKQIKGQGKLF